MSPEVVDASVVVKWLLPEEGWRKARELTDGTRDIHVPEFALLEVDNVLCTYLRRGDLTMAEVLDARAKLPQTPLRLHPLLDLRDEAFAIASQTGRSCHDCLYVALAMALAGRVVTADRRVFNALRETPFGAYVAWIEDV